jgi:thiamine transport system ATP-binding protein
MSKGEMISILQGHYIYNDFHLEMDFKIERGECVAILGPSGAGKSTLLNLLAGFEKLTDGTITINGKVMQGKAPALFPVSMIFQDNNTFAQLDVHSNVALGISPNLRLGKNEMTIVNEALTQVGLQHLAVRKPGEMSGGERQRIALARVVVRNKPVLLLDEPFGALGPALRIEMLDLVARLHREKNLTTLMITHHPDDAKRIASQVMFVDGGKVRAPVPTPKFFLYKNDPDVAVYLGTTA